MSVKKKPKKPQVQLPGIRVSDEAWKQGKSLKALSALTGVRVTLGEIFTALMLQHGPKMEADLQKKYDALRNKAKIKQSKKVA